jgi:ABC-2 type transport system ATP-binding protein
LIFEILVIQENCRAEGTDHKEVRVTGANAIEAVELTKSYGEHVQALDGLTFSVPAGTVFGLLGPNGAGKSTTVKILTTLAHPDGGGATVAGFDILREPARVRESIGVVSQAGGLDREATGRENLRLQGQVFGMGGRELEARIDALLEQFRLGDAGDRLVREYSGGMQRRLDVAQGLVHKPQVLFLDEPTTGLDPEVRQEMWDEIARLAGEGLTVLLTTHYLEEADNLAAQLAIVDKGKVVAAGSPDELKRELRGDAIHVELGTEGVEEAAVREALARVDGLDQIIYGEDRTMHARAEDGARTVPAVLMALDDADLEVASVTVARPSLDDVYLRFAGRTFGEAESGDGARPTGNEKKEAVR